MSRIGNKQINVPAGVTVDVNDNNFVKVKGPKGELSFQFNNDIKIEQDGTVITLTRPSDAFKAIHGTTRAVLANMVSGVSNGFNRRLIISGVGYRAVLQGKKLVVSAGYSHPVELIVPEGLSVELPKNTEINVTGIDKQKVSQFAAVIREIRKPEPYKGKGIRYDDERIRRKEGKTAKK